MTDTARCLRMEGNPRTVGCDADVTLRLARGAFLRKVAAVWTFVPRNRSRIVGLMRAPGRARHGAAARKRGGRSLHPPRQVKIPGGGVGKSLHTSAGTADAGESVHSMAPGILTNRASICSACSIRSAARRQ